MLDILEFPFMQRALLAGVVLAALLACLGIFVTLRRMAFFGDGIAHASLAGIAIALLAGANPLPIAIGYAILIAVGIYVLEKKTSLSSDTIIGIFFTASMSLGVILITLQSGYQPELISFLFGNILSISAAELPLILIGTSILFLFILYYFKPLTQLAVDREMAYLSGINVTLLDLALYISLAVAVVLGVKILGIILVSALIIIPPATAKLLAISFRGMVVMSVLIAELTVTLGIVVSYVYNLPTGATIVLAGTALFIIAFTLTRIRH